MDYKTRFLEQIVYRGNDFKKNYLRPNLTWLKSCIKSTKEKGKKKTDLKYNKISAKYYTIWCLERVIKCSIVKQI